MSGLNWARSNRRELMRVRGTEPAAGDDPPIQLWPKARRKYRRRLSKAEQRDEAARLVAEFKAKN